MICLQNIDYFIRDKQILHNINLQIDTGQVVALIGPNGAGKSTLFSVMARVNTPKNGHVCFGDCNTISTPNDVLSLVMAMLTQENHVQGRLRVHELLLFGRYPHHKGRPSQKDLDKVNEVLKLFELEDLAMRFLSDLSGGQRQRALIAMVVCQDTPYILLDEPLNNLDMYYASRLMRIINDLAKKGKTIVMVIHDINHAAQFCDSIIMLKNGQVIAQGAPKDVLTIQSIKDLYNVDAALLSYNDRPVIVC